MVVKDKRLYSPRKKGPKIHKTFVIDPDHLDFMENYRLERCEKGATEGFVIDKLLEIAINEVKRSSERIEIDEGDLPIDVVTIMIGNSVNEFAVSRVLLQWLWGKKPYRSSFEVGRSDLLDKLIAKIRGTSVARDFVDQMQRRMQSIAQNFYALLDQHLFSYNLTNYIMSITTDVEQRKALVMQHNYMANREMDHVFHLSSISSELRFLIAFGLQEGHLSTGYDVPAWVFENREALAAMNHSWMDRPL